jgi:mono/diheme cytochrome c family protein
VKTVFKLLPNLNFSLIILLSFLMIFDQKINLPEWMITFGRMHAIVLHLPIGLFFGYFLFEIIASDRNDLNEVKNSLLQVTISSALTAALFGLFLSTEQRSYDVAQISNHKYLGYAFALMMYLFGVFGEKLSKTYRIGALSFIALIMTVAGHYGASITHGENYLFPKKEEEKADKVLDETASMYERVVFPIFEAKCVSCHQPSKSKGGLIMTDTSSFAKGGEKGPIFIKGNADSSRMIQYALLPMEDELHMAPKGKPQLTEDEVELIKAWIASGGDFHRKVNEYDLKDTFKVLFTKILANSAKFEKIYAFDAVDEKVVDQLNTSFRSVKPLSNGSPALVVKYILPSLFTSQSFGDLLKVKDNIIELNLANTKVTDQDLSVISQLSNLEKLILNSTEVKDLSGIKNLKNLQQLSIMDTKLASSSVASILALPMLKSLYASGATLSSADLEKIKQKKTIILDLGKPSTELTKLTPPLLANKSTVISEGGAQLKHPINGVTIHYTIDGSKPDSTSTIYKDILKLDKPTVVKAVAAAPGWLASDPFETDLLPTGVVPSDLKVFFTQDPKYDGRDEKVVIDGARALPTNALDPGWLAYTQGGFSGTFTFKEPIALNNIAVSFNNLHSNWIFPPEGIEVLAGNSPDKLVSISKIKNPPPQSSDNQNIKYQSLAIKNSNSYQFYKVIVSNLKKIPSWHPGKGNAGWLFIDEVFFYK